MSEYQYFEFQAVDRPLTEGAMRALRAYSTRATITPTRFVNHYEWGDFKGSPLEWMERYFDAFLYLASWGTRELMLRLPRRALAPAKVRRYVRGESASVRLKGEHVILRFHSESDDGDWDDDGSGWLASLIPLRVDLASGDDRALYLAWLLAAQSGEVDDATPEPPVPAGLGRLSAPWVAFADFLRIDEDLIAAAAERSADSEERATSKEALARFVSALSDAEKAALLVRIAEGEGARLGAELLRRFRGGARRVAATARPRTFAALRSAAERRADERQRRAAEQTARDEARRRREKTIAREKYLKSLAKREPAAWRKVTVRIATLKPSAYDEAVRLLRDLRDVAARAGRAAEARRRIERLRDEHARKPSFVARLRRAGLGARDER